jgi:hypothetical protein
MKQILKKHVIYILGVKFWQAAPLAGTCIPVKV